MTAAIIGAHAHPRAEGAVVYVPSDMESAIADAVRDHVGPFSFDGHSWTARRPDGRGDPLTGRGRGPRRGSISVWKFGVGIIEMCGKASLMAKVYMCSPYVAFMYQPSDRHPVLLVPEGKVPAWMHECAARAWPIVEQVARGIDAGAEHVGSVALSALATAGDTENEVTRG